MVNKIKQNDYKKVSTANWLLLGTSAINCILMLIGRWTIFRLENWIGYSSWAIFIFCVFAPVYIGSLMLPFAIKAHKKIKQKNSKNTEIKISFINFNNIIINIIYMIFSLFWLFLASWYLMKINIIQAIFVIFISIFSLFYISYCFFFQTKIKTNKIKLSNFIEVEKQKCRCLCNLHLDTNDQK